MEEHKSYTFAKSQNRESLIYRFNCALRLFKNVWLGKMVWTVESSDFRSSTPSIWLLRKQQKDNNLYLWDFKFIGVSQDYIITLCMLKTSCTKCLKISREEWQNNLRYLWYIDWILLIKEYNISRIEFVL